nr:NADH dehydrogenase subunit 6 [Potamon fluviatile]UZH44832.1 NADH dehydrogenase subunit 6 [Potamon fluviatile]
MLSYAIPLIMYFSFLFTRLSHPLAMGMTLLIQTTMISISAGLTTYSFWFSYILFLIFLGGMLVLFIYVASLASNESFYFSMTSVIYAFLLPMIITSLLFLFDPVLSAPVTNLPNSSINMFSSTSYYTSWIFNIPSMFFTFFIICYLLLTLVVVIKIINLFKGPLRLMN